METILQQKRGQLTSRIKNKSKELIGYEINQKELRLMPYIQYQMMNSHKINFNCINQIDEEIILKWKKYGHIQINDDVLVITKEFWNIINEILFLGYVDLTY